MLFQSSKNVSKRVLDALDKSLAIIEFKPDGTIIRANNNFLNAMGYTEEEVAGKHHSMFVDPKEASSSEYKAFWKSLAEGEFQSAEYQRFGKGGKEVWIQASYNPVIDDNDNVIKVVKFATDITEQKLRTAEYQGKIEAIEKAQAVIEFELDGTIIRANDNFLNAVGYTEEEIVGKHHKIFIDEEYRQSDDYKTFWEELKAGEHKSGEYRRICKNGEDVWIQATYNPIFDMNGRPFKVVKFASDVTDSVHRRHEFERIVRYVNESLDKTGESLDHATGQASASSTETLSVIQTVSSAVEEMNSSIKEISNSVGVSQSAVGEAMEQSQGAEQYTDSLNQAAEQMTGIVAIIEDITSQINLLALNATIEAARAGEAGKGFAVVANEVKNLAGQASKATVQITDEISNMQGISSNVVGSMDTIRKSVNDVMENINSVAGAIEEQTAVTSEIASNMQMASQATNEVTDSIENVVKVSTQTKDTADDIRTQLSKLSDESA